MALKVRSASESADKLVQRAQGASGEYATQAAGAGEAWNTATQGAKANYQQAITAAGIADRFARGVAKVGAAGYALGITQKGRDRFSSGVALGKAKFTANVEPYLSTIASLSLSARQPRGSAANYNRVSEVGRALNAKRLALLGVSAGG